MNRSCCGKNSATTLVRWCGALAPGAGLLLIPKCPVCVVGYLALFTGVGISLPLAAGLKWALIVLSGALSVFFVIRLLTNPPK